MFEACLDVRKNKISCRGGEIQPPGFLGLRGLIKLAYSGTIAYF